MPPTACVFDVLRCRVVCPEAEKMLALVDMLLENTTVSVEVMVEGKWQVASLELVRLKNKARAYISSRVTVACA